MKRVELSIGSIFALSIAFLISFSSCENEPDAISGENNTSLTGVFVEELIEWEADFFATDSIVFENNNVYVMGVIEKTVDNWHPVIAVLDTVTMDVSYDSLPLGVYDAFAVSDEGYLLLSCLPDENGDTNVYRIVEVSKKDGVIVWENTLFNMNIVPMEFFGDVNLIGKNKEWYIAVGNIVVTLTNDGKIEHTEEFPSDVLQLKKDQYGQLHVWGNAYHKVMDNSGALLDAELINNKEIYFIAGYDYCYTNESGIYGHLSNSENDTEIMNWTNSGIVFSRGVRNLAVVSPETIYIYGSDGIGGETGLWKYTKSDDIVLDSAAIINVDYTEDGRNQIPLAAVKFNAAQANYHIVLNERSSSDTNGDLMDSIDKAILDGSIGDIVVTQDIDTLRKYGERGVFADLYSLMNDDMSADDIFGCVRQACEINRKLYGIPREFTLETYAAKNTDDTNLWNIDAFIAYASSLGDDKRALLYMTQRDVYNVLRDSVISVCVDLENHTCSFDSDTFRNFLSYISSLPKENTEELDWNENYYMNGKVALCASDISSYASYYQMKSVFGEEADAKIVGYPSAEGGASKFTANAFYSIPETSDVKEGALTFIRYLLSADCVIDEMRGMRSIPSLKTTAKAWDESEGKLYYFFYYDNVGRWTADEKPITAEDEGTHGVCIQLTAERINEVYDFLDTVKVYPYIPASIAAIVEEDMEAFLNTAKTAEETAKVIQSRVSTYLSERE